MSSITRSSASLPAVYLGVRSALPPTNMASAASTQPTAQQQQQSDAFIAGCSALQPTRDYKGLYRMAQDAEFSPTSSYTFILESVLGLELVAALCQHDLYFASSCFCSFAFCLYPCTAIARCRINARFCWKRIPENFTATQGGSRVLKALHKVHCCSLP